MSDKVYCLIQQIDYEGEYLIDVYRRESDALKEGDKLASEDGYSRLSTRYVVTEKELK